MRVLTASDRALLVEADDLEHTMRLYHAWNDIAGVVERIPGARTVLVRFDPFVVTAEELERTLRATEIEKVDANPPRDVTIPVHYDGEDLREVAEMLGVSREHIVQHHLAALWRVAFTGFAPGFGYAVSADPLFQVQRRSSPRTHVPAGSVGLAGAFTGVYPRESPGGWQLIGHTDAVMWDIDREPPALLVPGARVRFVRAERRVVRADSSATRMPHTPPLVTRIESRRPCVEVLEPGLQLLVEDRGRSGHAALGVSSSGAADRTALRDANRAVGNEPHAAAFEGVGGATLCFHGDGVAVVTGAIGDLLLTDPAGAFRPVPHGEPFAVFDGAELRVGPPARGLRYVIGVRGGLHVQRTLGSMSTDTLAGLGPAAFGAGDVVAIGALARYAVDPSPALRELPAAGELVPLDITLGPRNDWFTPESVRLLASQEWLVTPESNRVGIRLHGESPLERSVDGELPSEGAVTGALQVPPDGQPVLFLRDHPLTVGYPIVAALTDRSLDLAAQLPPGTRVRLRPRQAPRRSISSR